MDLVAELQTRVASKPHVTTVADFRGAITKRKGCSGKEADQNRRAARVPLEHKMTDLPGKAASYS